MALDREVIAADDSTVSTTVVSDSNGGLAIDYSNFYNRIASALETIADNSTALLSAQTAATISAAAIATQTQTIATQISAISQLASGTGVHTMGPIDWVGLISTYKLYVEDPEAIGLDALKEYFDKINELPKNF